MSKFLYLVIGLLQGECLPIFIVHKIYEISQISNIWNRSPVLPQEQDQELKYWTGNGELFLLFLLLYQFSFEELSMDKDHYLSML